MPGNRCSNCVTYNYDCTYVEAAKVCLYFRPYLGPPLIAASRNEDHPRGLLKIPRDSLCI